MLILPETSIAQAAEVIANGGVVAHATETCYGLTCNPYNPTALQKLFAIKNRPLQKPCNLLVASAHQAEITVGWNETAQQLAQNHWPGALTLVMRNREPKKLRVSVVGEPIWVGVRVSSHPVAQGLVEAIGHPIITTSANVSSAPEVYTVGGLHAQLEGQSVLPDLVIDSGTLPPNPPSTVVKIDGENIEVLRKGGVEIVL